MTVTQAMQEFIIDQQIKRNSQRTIQYYQSSMMMFQTYIQNKSLQEITLQDLKLYTLHLMNRPNTKDITIQSYIRALRVFLNWCYDKEYIDAKHTDKYKLPKAKKAVIDVLTDDEVRRLFACFNIKNIVHLRNYCMCLLMLDSGLRIDEVLTLGINKITLKRAIS